MNAARWALALLSISMSLAPWPSGWHGIDIAAGASFVAGCLMWEAARPSIMGA